MADVHPPYPEQGQAFTADETNGSADSQSSRILKQLGNNIFLAGATVCQATEKALEAGAPMIEKAKQDAKEMIDGGMEMAQGSGLTQYVTDFKDKAADIKERVCPFINQGRAMATEFAEREIGIFNRISTGIIEFTSEEIERAKAFVQECGIPLSQPPVAPGCVVQLVSASAGGAVQIVTRDGALMLDARGPLDVHAFNTLWRVVRGAAPDTLALHNHRNFITLAHDRKSSALTHVPDDPTVAANPPCDAELVLRQHCLLATLEFASEPGSFLGFGRQGELVAPKEAVLDHNHCLAVRVVTASKGTDL